MADPPARLSFIDMEVPDDKYQVPWLARWVGEKTGTMGEDGITKHGASYTRAMYYAEMQNLPRGVRGPNGIKKLEPGAFDPAAELYPVFGTTVHDLGEFGLGLSMYFNTLRVLIGTLLLCGVLNLGTASYFGSDKYSGGSSEQAEPYAMIPGNLEGSAYCPDSRHIPVLVDDGNGGYIQSEMHNCPFNAIQGQLDLASTIVFLVVLLVLGHFQDKSAEAIDESQQTAEDYSVEVVDPGDGAADNDPLAWKKFFEQFGGSEVTAVTIAKKNGTLLKLLSKRKVLLERLKKMCWDDPDDEDFIPDDVRQALHKGYDVPSQAILGDEMPEGLSGTEMVNFKFKQILMGAGIAESSAFMSRKLGKFNTQIEAEVKRLQTPGNSVNARVYVSYEHEESQRKCLAALSTGTMLALFDIPKPDWLREMLDQPHAPKSDTFHGNVLHVKNAPEPSDIRWQNLDVEPEAVFLSSFFITGLGLGIVAALGSIIAALSEANPEVAAFAISLSNTVFPVLMKTLNSFEPHATNTATQASLLFKLVAARWTTSVIVVYALTKWKDTLKGEKVVAIMAILMADAITTPIIRLLNIGPNVNRMILAPLAKTQDGMNRLFKGAGWFLAERFSDMTKTVMICFFYSALLPIAYFVTAFALLLNYWVDKYCLLRMWQVPPKLNARIVATTRAHLAIVLLFHCVITMHYYAGWPFDDIVCRKNGNVKPHDEDCAVQSVNTYYLGQDTGWQVSKVNSNLWHDGLFIVFAPRSYFTHEQMLVVGGYQVFVIISMVIIFLFYFGHAFGFTLYSMFIGTPQDGTDVARRPANPQDDYYKEGCSGEPIEYSSVETDAYVPEVIVPGLDQPQLAVYHPDFERNTHPVTEDGGFDISHSWFPREMLSWNEVPLFNVYFKDNNLFLDEAMDTFCPDLKERAKLFSSCNVFKPPDLDGSTVITPKSIPKEKNEIPGFVQPGVAGEPAIARAPPTVGPVPPPAPVSPPREGYTIPPPPPGVSASVAGDVPNMRNPMHAEEPTSP